MHISTRTNAFGLWSLINIKTTSWYEIEVKLQLSLKVTDVRESSWTVRRYIALCKHSSLANRKEGSQRKIYKKRSEKHTVIQSQRYVSRQADIQPHIHTITETDMQSKRQTITDTDILRDRKNTVTETDNHGDRHTFSKTDKRNHIDRQSRRQTFSETEKYSHRDRQSQTYIFRERHIQSRW